MEDENGSSKHKGQCGELSNEGEIKESFARDDVSPELFADESSNSESDYTRDSVAVNKVINNPLPVKLFRKTMRMEENISNVKATENVCMKFCKRGCSQTVSDMSYDEKVAMRLHFVGQNKTETKTKLLQHLKTQCILDINATNFAFKSQIYCVKAFASVTGISDYIVSKVLKDFEQGFEQYTHGTAGVPRQSLAHGNFVGWMLVFVELHGQADPEKVTSVLPAFLNKAELFKIYSKEAAGPQLKQSTFYFLMKKIFGVNRTDKSLPNIRIRNGFRYLNISLSPPSPTYVIQLAC